MKSFALLACGMSLGALGTWATGFAQRPERQSSPELVTNPVLAQEGGQPEVVFAAFTGRVVASLGKLDERLRRMETVLAASGSNSPSASEGGERVEGVADAPEEPPAARAARAEAERAVTRAIERGTWTTDDRVGIAEHAALLPAEARSELLTKLAVAANAGRIRFDDPSNPLELPLPRTRP